MKELTTEEKAKAYDEAIEDFTDIQDYEGLYKINRKGEVLSVRSGKLLKAGKNKQGYMNVVLSKNGESKVHKVHRLVARTFIPNPNNYPYINHKDEDKTNNHSNIDYPTKYKRYATRHREQHGSLSTSARPIAQYSKDGLGILPNISLNLVCR